MALAVVRSIGTARSLRSDEDLEEFEQELVDQFLLAGAAAGLCDSTLSADRYVVFEFSRFLGRPLWTARPDDADRFLVRQRRELERSRLTVHHKAVSLGHFYDFLVSRYQGDIHAVTGYVVEQVIDEFNRPSRGDYFSPRVPPCDEEIESLFGQWRQRLAQERKFLPAARDYVAASLWRRVGLRIQETYMLDLRDWHRDLGEFGKIHVRFGKGNRGRGPKPRFVPAIDQASDLLDWWLCEVRHQFGDDYENPGAPLFPSERRDPYTGLCLRIGAQALRCGLEESVARWLPQWRERLTPHGLRHYCASSLYGRGLDIKAIQELLGHEWLSTTTGYIHVRADHVERAWRLANERTAQRLAQVGG